MRYIFDISQESLKSIGELIKRKEYGSVAQFIETAIENQIYLEKQDVKENMYQANKLIHGIYNNNLDFYKKDNEINEIKLDIGKQIPPAVALPQYKQLSCYNEKLPEEQCWLWGQVNRIFPIKLGLRILLSYAHSNQWVELDGFLRKATTIASTFNRSICSRGIDNKEREEKISTGLPKSDKNEFRSQIRYRNHFLSYMRKDEKLDGALVFLKFVNLCKINESKIMIGLTEHGIEFAQIKNAVIDEGNLISSLTDKEVAFYLRHISLNVKGEYTAIKWALQKIESGFTKREKLNEELKKDLNPLWNVSDAIINTQRSGLMARMFELKLLCKTKNGVNVNYQITNTGKEFINK